MWKLHHWSLIYSNVSLLMITLLLMYNKYLSVNQSGLCVCVHINCVNQTGLCVEPFLLLVRFPSTNQTSPRGSVSHQPPHQLLTNKICLVLVKLIGLHPKREKKKKTVSCIPLETPPQWRSLSIAAEKKRSVGGGWEGRGAQSTERETVVFV